MNSYFFDSLFDGRKPIQFVKDKNASAKSYMRYMLIRLQKMFKYENLPETIPKEMLETYLITNGTCFITEVNGNLYAFTGGLGGEPDPYYRPTLYTVANPALNISKNYKIGEEGVLCTNDDMCYGLVPLMSRYASLLAENILTIRSADVMLRVLALLTAPDDKTRIAGETYLKKLEQGEFGVIAENRFFDGIKMQSPPSNNGSYLTQFIELHQYLTGSFFNEIGLNANYNMKREAINESESSLNEDSLLPLSENMLHCRKKFVEQVNKMYGTEISVDFDSAWKQNMIEADLSLKNMASQLATNEGENEEEFINTFKGDLSNGSGESINDEEEPSNDDGESQDDNEISSNDDRATEGTDGENSQDSDGESQGNDGEEFSNDDGIDIDIEIEIGGEEDGDDSTNKGKDTDN